MKTSLSKKGNTYKGRKVTLNKPFYTPGERKKSAVYVKNPAGKVVIVRFGDPNMEIKRDNPERRRRRLSSGHAPRGVLRLFCRF
jgi:hypothetical protein